MRSLFFSSRRRHTRWNCDWSSDVCSSDLELFGHRRGAFTGATHDQRGLFEAASGGTILLDEIGEMPPAMQAKLLRVLQEGEVRPVGDRQTRKIDVRVISATNRDLTDAVARRVFRDDLYYRVGADRKSTR